MKHLTKRQKEVVNHQAQAVADVMGITKDMIFKAHTRLKPIVKARQALIYLIKNNNQTKFMTLESIGKLFAMDTNGGRRRKKPYMDHSNVVHAYNRADTAMTPDHLGNLSYDPPLRDLISAAVAVYQQRTGEWSPVKGKDLWQREKNVKDRIKALENQLEQIRHQKRVFYENN